MTVYVFSTLAADQDIPLQQLAGDGRVIFPRFVKIRGGAQLAKTVGGEIVTPLGIKTELSDTDYNIVKDDFTFKHFVSQGKLIVREGNADAETVASDMTMPSVSEGAPINETELLQEADALSPEGVEVKVYEETTVRKRK